MTEAARKTLEEIQQKMEKELNDKVSKKSLNEAVDEAMSSLAVLSGVIGKTVEKMTDDPMVCIGGLSTIRRITETVKAIGTYGALCEVAEMKKESKI